MSLISVIMPFYNSEKYLEGAVTSILNQTVNDFEFIVIDDGSSDRSKEIILGFSDKRIKLIENPKNLGVAQSLNIGLSVATGKWIARMDADDISLPNRFSMQCEFLDNNPEIKLIGTNYKNVTPDKEIVVNPPTEFREILLTLLFTTPFAHSSVMFNRHVQQTQKLFYSTRYPYNEDHEYWTQWVIANQLSNLKDILLIRNLNPNAISRRFYLQQVDDRNRLGTLFSTFLEKKIGLHISHPADLFRPPGGEKKKVFEEIIRFNEEHKYVNKSFLTNLLLAAWMQDAKFILETERKLFFKNFMLYPNKDLNFYMASLRIVYYYLRAFTSLLN